ncbi:hypothetical protein CTZ27_37355 [Streptomyces griseocarneus]|nr:hypothetical protein CTZ27_37355 [Streptomyces griseocarneus]
MSSVSFSSMRTTRSLSANNSGRTWDGGPKDYQPQRSLRIALDSSTRLLCIAQTHRCISCGNPVEWYCRSGDRGVPLHPYDLPTAAVPTDQRWHVSSVLAYPSGDGTDWCRVRHRAVCPATAQGKLVDLLAALHRGLAISSRRLTETGTFVPPADASPSDLHSSAAVVRPIVRFLHTCYLAPRPLEQTTCVAQARSHQRYPHAVLDPGTLPGQWALMPVRPRSDDQLPLDAIAGESMAVYDLPEDQGAARPTPCAPSSL